MHITGFKQQDAAKEIEGLRLERSSFWRFWRKGFWNLKLDFDLFCLGEGMVKEDPNNEIVERPPEMKFRPAAIKLVLDLLLTVQVKPWKM